MRLALLVLTFLAPLSALAQAPTPKQIAARVEIHPIQTLTLSDQQFLTGDRAGGKPTTISGEFRIAQGQGKLPVVVLMHGSGGVGPNVQAWVQMFNEMGISTFMIDGFTGRGITVTNTNQALLGRLNFILDIYRSLDILAKHPRVDPDRIVLMGFSRGGQAALYASVNRFQKLWNMSGASFAAYIPFYPDCSTQYTDDTDIAAKPIRIFHGEPDDYNPVGKCKPFIAALQKSGHDVTLTEYPDAQHGFDSPIGQVAVSVGSQTVRNCSIREGEGGQLINASTNAPFTYKDACVETDPHVGANAAARQAAYSAVTDYLRRLFKLN